MGFSVCNMQEAWKNKDDEIECLNKNFAFKSCNAYNQDTP